MKKDSQLFRLIVGLLITVTVFAVSLYISRVVRFNSDFIPSSFSTDVLMLQLSVALILVMRKQVNYRIALPSFKSTLRPILFGFLSAVVINITIGLLAVALSGSIDTRPNDVHPVVARESVLQFVLFTLVLASVAEEFLFRGFFQNYLSPLKTKGFSLFRRRISLPVFIGALTFGLAHLILLSSGVGVFFVVRIVLFTFTLGLIAGYYQEKYDNHAYAIIVHMSGNLMGVIGIMMM